MTDKTYTWPGKHFSVTFRDGLIASLTAREDDNAFVGPGGGFGEPSWHLKPTGSDTDDDGTYTRFADTAEREESFTFTREHRDYTVSGVAGPLRVTQHFTATDDGLIQTLTFTCLGDEAVTLDGLRVHFPLNTEFHWGDHAGSKILPSIFIAKDGSHLQCRRCDGKMPGLLVLPAPGSPWEHFDLSGVYEGYDNHGTTPAAVYLHAAQAAEEARRHESRIRLDGTARTLSPGESCHYRLQYYGYRDEAMLERLLVTHGLAALEVMPGMTCVQDHEARLHVMTHTDLVTCDGDEGLEVRQVVPTKDGYLLRLSFTRTGPCRVRLHFEDARSMFLDFFITEPLETLIKKRAAFIASKQVHDASRWYDGLLCEWNATTGVMLTPDNYDDIKGWRRYEVTCDDPGLSKPAFLSSKQYYWPDQTEIDALDTYIDCFVDGGLQRSDDEDYAYGIYGIPDWHTNRHSEDPDVGGREHLWRIYDYPHLYLMYYNMYRTAKAHPDYSFAHPADTYLYRAYRTCLALYTIPHELVAWSAYETGLYNECVILDLIRSLEDEGWDTAARRLRRHWDRKTDTFLQEDKDIFGSEYPFDTTGFESTYYLAESAIERSLDQDGERKGPDPTAADRFLHAQATANMACRGRREMHYWSYGSDYRGNNYKYLLSYMSQMGGQALLAYAIRHLDDYEEKCRWIRVAYGSLMSAWALVNSGAKADGYGYWFPGEAHDGAASGGFEPLPYGQTWLGPDHRFGPWYYACEIDLGFCGALRGASTVVVDDPCFGPSAYGGTLLEAERDLVITPHDGIRSRFTLVTREGYLMLDLGHYKMDAARKIRIAYGSERVVVPLEGPVNRENLERVMRIDDGLGMTVSLREESEGTALLFERRATQETAAPTERTAT